MRPEQGCLIVIGLVFIFRFHVPILSIYRRKKKHKKSSKQSAVKMFYSNATEVVISDVDRIFIQSHVVLNSEQLFTSVLFFIKVLSNLLWMHFKISFIIHFWLTLDTNSTLPIYTVILSYGSFVYLFYIFTRLANNENET